MGRPMLKSLGCAACAGVFVAVLLGGADSASAGGGLLVSPVIVDQPIKKTGETLPPIKVVNQGNEDLDVSIMFSTLGHDRTGTPNTPPESYKYNASKMFTVKPDKFKLKAGQTVDVIVKADIPSGRVGGAYATMYVLGKPKQKASESITSYIQVGVIIELALPGVAKHRISPGKVFATQEKLGAPVTLYAAANNMGEVHDKVGGIVIVTNDKNVEVAKLNLEPANVLPAMSRDIKATWRAPKTLAPGKYKVTATLSGTGFGNETAYGTLEVVNPGEIVRTVAMVNKFQTAPVVKQKPVNLEATVTNQGNAAFAPSGKVSFLDAKGVVVATAVLTSASIAPGKKGVLKGTLAAGLPTATYTAKLEVMNAEDFVLANASQTQQVIDKDVSLSGKISLKPPSAKEPFVAVEFTNSGNADVDVEGVINVTDSSGNVAGVVPLEKQHVAVGGKASFKRGLPEGLEKGVYELRAILNYGGASPADGTVKHYVQ